MRCGFLGIAAISFGVGVLVGGLLPSCLVIWILGIALLAAGIFLIRC